MKTLLLVILLIQTASAHDEHDWRLDYEAYLNVQTEVKPLIKMRADRIAKRIDMGFFREKLTKFTSINRRRQEDLDVARSFLMEEYKALGLETSLHNFGGGINVIAEKKGTIDPSKVLIISSHIDSVGNKGAMIMAQELSGP